MVVGCWGSVKILVVCFVELDVVDELVDWGYVLYVVFG